MKVVIFMKYFLVLKFSTAALDSISHDVLKGKGKWEKQKRSYDCELQEKLYFYSE